MNTVTKEWLKLKGTKLKMVSFNISMTFEVACNQTDDQNTVTALLT
jgi:hypothetical protein